GEHGVGRGKRDYLADELDDHTLDAMRDVKALFDPEGILNPGKVFR
ncbi:MAG: FAD-linked oxidase C-terminal domain-containing protein, partial [Haloarculaceae archaeon]